MKRRRHVPYEYDIPTLLIGKVFSGIINTTYFFLPWCAVKGPKRSLDADGDRTRTMDWMDDKLIMIWESGWILSFVSLHLREGRQIHASNKWYSNPARSLALLNSLPVILIGRDGEGATPLHRAVAGSHSETSQEPLTIIVALSSF